MRSWIVAGLGLLVLPCVVDAQPARHEMPAILRGNPADWFGADQYPADALAAERQGRVIADISVDLTGQATACRIEVSSGTTSLDKATCDIALAHASFNPATNSKGKPVTTIFRLPVSWQLPDSDEPIEAKNAKTDSSGAVQISVDKDGLGVSCHTITMINQNDPCADFIPGRSASNGFVRDGRKVGATITRKWSSTTTIDP